MNFKRHRPSWIHETMKKNNLVIRKRFGQNFLIDEGAIERILHALDLKGGENLLEIGPGLGVLTERLLEKDLTLYAVEIDRDLAALLEEELDQENFHLIVDDVLKINPMDLPEPLVILGNLPYYITSAIIMHFLESDLDITRMVLMMQKEVAARLVAQPGSKDYGILSVITQSYGEVEKLFDVGKNCFLPAPKVESTVVSIVPHQERTLDPLALAIIKGAFSLRRKTILNALSTTFEKGEILEACRRTGIDPSSRAEKLTIDDYKKLRELWPAG